MGLHKLPQDRALRAMMGRMVFYLEGFEEEHQTWQLPCPVLQKFWQRFHQTWPYGQFFCDLEQHDFRIMTFARMKSVKVIRLEEQSNHALFFDPDELRSLLNADEAHLLELAKQAGLSGPALAKRRRTIREYFGLHQPSGGFHRKT